VGELRLGLVGCGRLAERGYVPAARLAQDVRLAAVADPVLARCAYAAPGVPSYTSAAELLDARAADLLVLATPAHAHLRDARLAAEAGIPTLVEKPPAPTAREAAELARLDPPPWIGFNRRFDRGIGLLRESLRDVVPLELSLVFHARRDSWRSYEASDGLLFDFGPHLVDLALWLSRGRPTHVTGRVDKHRAAIDMELADKRGIARITCAGNRPYLERVDVRAPGRSFSLKRGGIGRSLWSLITRSAESQLVPSLTRQLEAFARAARGGTQAELATASDGVTVMETLEAVGLRPANA
jgi:predicted dehydrogenase